MSTVTPSFPGLSIAPPSLRLGCVTLTDAAPLVVAEARGLFAAHGVRAAVLPMASWAAVRDRLVFGAVDAAQVLSPMPIAAAAGLGGVGSALAVTATLGRNGNTVTLGRSLLADIVDAAGADAAGAGAPIGPPMSGAALAAGLARRRAAGRPPAVLAVVFPFSSHAYLLRHFLAAAGIDPDRDVRLTVVPPPQTAERLAEGAIDGFCAGEPWGSRAVALGAGRIVLTTADIWPNHPEKVLAVPADMLARDRPRVVALTAALIAAGRWLDDPANRAEAAALLHERLLPGLSPSLLAGALAGAIVPEAGAAPVPMAPILFHRDGAGRPDPAHGAWWEGQMRRWHHLPAALPGLSARIWRPDVWAEASALAGDAVPAETVDAEDASGPGWTAPAAPPISGSAA